MLRNIIPFVIFLISNIFVYFSHSTTAFYLGFAGFLLAISLGYALKIYELLMAGMLVMVLASCVMLTLQILVISMLPTDKQITNMHHLNLENVDMLFSAPGENFPLVIDFSTENIRDETKLHSLGAYLLSGSVPEAKWVRCSLKTVGNIPGKINRRTPDYEKIAKTFFHSRRDLSFQMDKSVLKVTCDKNTYEIGVSDNFAEVFDNIKSRAHPSAIATREISSTPEENKMLEQARPVENK